MPSLALAAVALFAFALLMLRTRSEEAEDRTTREGTSAVQRSSARGLPPAELALRIFSPTDRTFIRLTRSTQLQRLYEKERRDVALHWVRRISHEVRQIMRNHRLSSRQSADLNVVAETKLFYQYLQLRFLCVLLLVLIQIFGPHALVDVAAYTSALGQRIGQALPEVTRGRRVPSSGNVAA